MFTLLINYAKSHSITFIHSLIYSHFSPPPKGRKLNKSIIIQLSSTFIILFGSCKANFFFSLLFILLNLHFLLTYLFLYKNNMYNVFCICSCPSYIDTFCIWHLYMVFFYITLFFCVFISYSAFYYSFVWFT